MQPTTRTYGIQELAQVLGLHYMTVYLKCRGGKIQYTRVGRELRIPASEALRLAAGK